MRLFLNWSQVGFPQTSTSQHWSIALDSSFTHCSNTVPTGSSSPSLPAPPQSPFHKLQLGPRASSVGISMGCAYFRPHPLLQSGLLHSCTWRSVLCSVHELQGTFPCLEHLMLSWNTTDVPHGSSLASSGCLLKPLVTGSHLTHGSFWALLTEDSLSKINK